MSPPLKSMMTRDYREESFPRESDTEDEIDKLLLTIRKSPGKKDKSRFHVTYTLLRTHV